MSFLLALIVLLGGCLAVAVIGYALRPDRKGDVMQQAIGDAPRLVRGGYAAMDEKQPMQAKRPA
jgi:hypothetical protein